MMKPILFNTEMVRAIKAGKKKETRRIIKAPPAPYSEDYDGKLMICDRFGDWHPAERFCHIQPGSALYVREAWGDYRECSRGGEGPYFLYRADYPDGAKTYRYPGGQVCDLPSWHPSIHMPKEAARIFLKVTDVRAERLNAITEEGAIREGLYPGWRDKDGDPAPSALTAFAWLWNTTVKPEDMKYFCWTANPWVYVISFEEIRREEAERLG